MSIHTTLVSTTREQGLGEAGLRSVLSERRLLLPICISALIAGTWTPLAFVPGSHHALSLLVAVAATLCWAILFTLVTATAGSWARTQSSLHSLQLGFARASAATVLLLLFLPEYLARLRPPMLRSALLLTLMIGLWLALLAMQVLDERRTRWTTRTTNLVAGSALTLLFAIVTGLAIRKYLVFGYVGQDLAYFAQIMHTTLHGHLFWGNVLQDVLYSQPVTTDFAGHNSPFMFLFLPFYAAFPSPITLLVLRNVVLILCALPVYLIARRRVSPIAAWLWAAALLVTPAILYQSTFDFYPLSFVALPLLFALYFYFEHRYLPFLLALALTLSVREDLALFAVGLGVLALIRHRSTRWWLAPLAAGLAWGALSALVVLPTSLHGASFVTDACFSHLGPDRSAILQNLLHHPTSTIAIHANVVYLKTLLTPTALITAAGSPFSLLSLPFVAINLLAGGGRCITTVIFAQYSVIPALLLFLGSMLTATNFNRPGRLFRFAHLGLSHAAAAPALMIAMGCASLIFVTGQPQFDEMRTQPWEPEAQTVLNLIPKDASVAVPRYMLPHLANRDCLFQTHRLGEYHTPAYEYLVLDKDWSHINAAERYHVAYDQMLKDHADPQPAQIVYQSPLYEVLRDPAAHTTSCYPAATPPATQPR